MKDELLNLMYRMYFLMKFLEALNEALGLEQSSDEAVRETARLSSDMDEQPEPVQEALSKWMRDRDCQLSDVPVVLATESYIAELAGELERTFYREKPGIIVAEGGFGRLVERLADQYQTDTALEDHLHVEMFTQLPGVIRRARKVRPLVLGQGVPVGLARRYKEAVRSYLAGYAIACCVLCRAVVEAALKDTLERLLKEQINLDYVTLSDLIERSSKVLPDHVIKSCRQIKSLGDKAVHRETGLSLDEAHQALMAAQQVLKSVFVEPIGGPSTA